MAWHHKKERRRDGLDSIVITGDRGDPLAVVIESDSDIGYPWDDFVWVAQIRSEVNANGTPTGTLLGTFVVADQGSTPTELKKRLALADTTIVATGRTAYFDLQSIAGSPVVGYTVARGTITPSGDVSVTA